MSSIDQTPLAILAGGDGSRMGIPKGLLRVLGRPILQFTADRLDWPGPLWLITAPGKEHPPGCESFDREFVDPQAGLGPLRGTLTALENLDAPDLIVATLDMPAMTRSMLEWIIEQLRDRPHALGVMCRRELEASEQIEPFPLALRAAAAPILRRRLESGQRSVRRLLEESSFTSVLTRSDWPPDVWLNLNTAADLEAFERRLSEIPR